MEQHDQYCCTALLLAQVLVKLQNTCKKLNRKMLKRPNICYIFEKLGVQGCQIYMTFPMCQSHSTRPQPIQLVPTMQKKLFMSSFQAKFLNWVKKSYMYMLIFTCNFFVLSVNQSRATFGPNKSPTVSPLTPKKCPKWPSMGQKWQKKHCGKLRYHLPLP